MPAATPPTQPRPPSLTAPPPRWRPSARSDRRHRPVADTPRPGRRPAPVAERSPAGDGAGPPWQRAARQMAGGEGGGGRAAALGVKVPRPDVDPNPNPDPARGWSLLSQFPTEGEDTRGGRQNQGWGGRG